MKNSSQNRVYKSHRKWVEKNRQKYTDYHKWYNSLPSTKERRKALYRKRIEHFKARDKAHYEKTKDRHRELSTSKRYGITVQQYRDLFIEHGNKCGICGQPERTKNKALSVDHNHKTGKVRGLLCGFCNKAIGYLNEDLELLPKIESYLKKYAQAP